MLSQLNAGIHNYDSHAYSNANVSCALLRCTVIRATLCGLLVQFRTTKGAAITKAIVLTHMQQALPFLYFCVVAHVTTLNLNFCCSVEAWHSSQRNTLRFFCPYGRCWLSNGKRSGEIANVMCLGPTGGMSNIVAYAIGLTAQTDIVLASIDNFFYETNNHSWVSI